eukprot:m.205779 g.205779  ORF g.205779 m.205779 type:complete len:601 (-) comp18881_c0_seq1:217-2019(-)
MSFHGSYSSPMGDVHNLSEAIATPTERLHLLEKELDAKESNKPKPSAPVSVASSRPVKTTVGFGAGSYTKLTPGSSSAERHSLGSSFGQRGTAAPSEAHSSPGGRDRTGSASRGGGRGNTIVPKVTIDNDVTSTTGGTATNCGGAAESSAAAGAGGTAKGPPKEFAKKPKLTKAERRALQEKQRAAKEAARADGGGKGGGGKKEKASDSKSAATVVSARITADDEKRNRERSKRLRKQNVPERVSTQKQVMLFAHLHQYDNATSLTSNVFFSSENTVHPAIMRLGLKMSEGIVSGSTNRCLAMLDAFKTVIQDYTTPPGKEMARDLTSSLSPLISFLTQCRPLADSMGNAIKDLKQEISQLPHGIAEDESKQLLIGSIDKFVQERIVLAQKVISKSAGQKIQDGDVILVHARSSLILKIITDAHAAGKNFRVIVVDSRPKLAGVGMLHALLDVGVQASYVLINALSYAMREATKVFLAAHALLANGFVMGSVGSSLISMMAQGHTVPVLVMCETYKFSERVQTDAFVFNELADPAKLAEPRRGSSAVNTLDGWQDVDQLKLLNLAFDVTPPEFVDIVITDLGMIPCTSVPVVLRVKEQQK